MHQKLLKVIGEIIDLNDDDITYIKKLFTPKEFKKGEYFIREGQIAREIGFVVNGLVAYYWNDDGEIKIFEFGKAGDFVANYKSCIESSPSEMVLQFLEETSMLCISAENLELFFQNVKQGEKFGRILLTKLFLNGVESITRFYRNTPELRYSEFMETHPDLLDRIPQYLISSYIGIKPQSLSRIKKRWQ
jgi:CRP-like cAMP-binding protein